MGTCEKVLGIVDRLLIDNAFMGELRLHHHNMDRLYYDYQKAYDMIHFD